MGDFPGPMMGDTDVAQEPAARILRLNYARKLFLVSTFAVLLFIVLSGGATAFVLVSRQHEELAQLFAAYRESLKEEVDHLQVSLVQLAGTARFALRHFKGDSLRVQELQREFAQGEVRLPILDDGPPSYFSVLTTLTEPGDVDRLARLLELVRFASTFPVAREDHSLAVSQGFIYTPDFKFLASLPPEGGMHERLFPSSNGSIEAVIGARVKIVEEAVRASEQAGKGGDVAWVTVSSDPVSGLLTTYYASSIYREGKRVATVVSSIPCSKFNQFFLHDEGDPHFFVVACRLQRLLGLDLEKPQEREWASIISRMPWIYADASERPKRVFREGSFFLYQRVPGPNWVAVYAYRWSDLLAGVGQELSFLLASMLLGCAVVGAGAYWIRKSILLPADAHLQSLLESEAFSRSAIQVAPVSLVVMDRDSGKVLVQNAEAKLLKQQVEVNAEATDGDLFKRVGELARQHAVTTRDEGVIRRFEMSPDIEVAYAQAKYHGRNVFVLGMVDLAKRKEIERRLRASRARAEAESREKGLFLATMSHEIRTPLHGALGNLELLGRMGLNPEQLARLSVAQDSFSSLLSLINDVLDFSKSEAGELTLLEAPAHPDRIVEQAARTFAAESQLAGVRLLCLIQPEARGIWHCDSTRLSQVVMNLLGNAVKFTERGSIAVTLSLHGEGGLVFSVADSGKGIAEEDIEKIFAPFAQGSIGKRGTRAGTGLGLALCNAIVKRMGGEIHVESELGSGSIFTVRLPLQKEPIEVVNAVPGPSPDFLIRCQNILWMQYLSKQLKNWYPKARITELERPSAISSIEAGEGTVFVDACERVEQMARVSVPNMHHVVVSLDGPMVAITQNGAVAVTAYSGELLKSTIDALVSEQASVASVSQHGDSPAVSDAVAKLSVLVVEDDRICIQLIQDQLSVLGIRSVALVDTAEAALDRFSAQAFDVVITDLNLPGKSGFELARALKERKKRTKVVLCTADVTISKEARSLFDDVVLKPSSLDDIANALNLPVPSGGAGATSTFVKQFEDKKRLAALFANDWAKDKVDLESMMANGDIKAVHARLHRIKGALLVLGASPAAHLIERFENADWRPISESARGLRSLIADVDALVDQLQMNPANQEKMNPTNQEKML
ncbi:hybrid sensor histidine kinase/response regulator [Pandoraea pulmonicola]|uniref:hybrid sensor histidine kinase/response regulator n=1 Tax=Pandoraea pulmonicola TaxID=93221 RepID=UPI0012F5221D|nr:ATP-binding protein [Pandoraea pulmonicola]